MDDLLECLERQEDEEKGSDDCKLEETQPPSSETLNEVDEKCQIKGDRKEKTKDEYVRDMKSRERELLFGTYVVYDKDPFTMERKYHKCVTDKTLTEIMSCKVFETEDYLYTAEVVESVFIIGGCRIMNTEERKELGNMKRFLYVEKDLPTIRLQKPGPPKLVHSDVTIHVEGTCERGVQFGIVGQPFLSCIQHEGRGSIKVCIQNEKGLLPLLFFGKENQERQGRQIFVQKKCELEIAYQQTSVRLATFRPRVDKILPRQIKCGEECCVIGKHLMHCYFYLVSLYPLYPKDESHKEQEEKKGEEEMEKISVQLFPSNVTDAFVVIQFPDTIRKEERAQHILVVSGETTIYVTEEMEVR